MTFIKTVTYNLGPPRPLIDLYHCDTGYYNVHQSFENMKISHSKRKTHHVVTSCFRWNGQVGFHKQLNEIQCMYDKSAIARGLMIQPPFFCPQLRWFVQAGLIPHHLWQGIRFHPGSTFRTGKVVWIPGVYILAITIGAKQIPVKNFSIFWHTIIHIIYPPLSNLQIE